MKKKIKNIFFPFSKLFLMLAVALLFGSFSVMEVFAVGCDMTSIGSVSTLPYGPPYYYVNPPFASATFESGFLVRFDHKIRISTVTPHTIRASLALWGGIGYYNGGSCVRDESAPVGCGVVTGDGTYVNFELPAGWSGTITARGTLSVWGVPPTIRTVFLDDNGNSCTGEPFVLTTELGPSVCANSFVENGEECDDGNLANGDGCSSTCQVEEAANEVPVITPTEFTGVAHDDNPPQVIPGQVVTCNDATDTITAFSVSGVGVTNDLPPSGLGTNSATITFDILNPDLNAGPDTAVFSATCTSGSGSGSQTALPRDYSVEFTDQPLTITPSFTTCGSHPITGNLGAVTCTASGTVTFTDPDPADSSLSITTNTTGLPPGVAIITPLPATVTPGTYPVVFGISGTPGGSVLFEGTTDHGYASASQAIGQSEDEKTWVLLPIFVDKAKFPPEVGDPEVIIRKKICYEVAIGSDGEEIGRRETGSGSADDEESFSLFGDIPLDDYEKAAMKMMPGVRF